MPHIDHALTQLGSADKLGMPANMCMHVSGHKTVPAVDSKPHIWCYKSYQMFVCVCMCVCVYQCVYVSMKQV